MADIKLDQQPHWIPITDKMPTPCDCFGTWYIVCDNHGHVFPLRYVKTTVRGRYVERWHTHFDTIYYGDVVAWMPLPEPYRTDT